MKKKWSLLLCLILCVFAFGLYATAQADAAASGPVPYDYGPPRITKNPTDEVVGLNGRCQFVSRYENAILAEWHFISPDGYYDYTYLQMQRMYPSLRIIMGNTKDMTLDRIPQELNGWRVYCRFTNNYGEAKTGTALITVLPRPSYDSNPWPTGNSMIVYYYDGTTERVAGYSDGSWRTVGGTVYTLGSDGILRAGYAPPLYIYNPSSGSGSLQPTGRSMNATYAGGGVDSVTEYSDGTWRTRNGLVYYLGTDGVLRSNGAPDLYAGNPSYIPRTQASIPVATPIPAGQGMVVYHSNGQPEYVTDQGDGTWVTPGGTIYTRGSDNVLRSKGAEDLYIR